VSLLAVPPIDPYPLIINSISGDVSGSIFEIAIPLAWIGNPDKIDIVFIASLTGFTDLAGPMRYQVYRPRPVGGYMLPVNKLEVLAPYLALVGLVGAVTAAVAIRRRNPAKPFLLNLWA